MRLGREITNHILNGFKTLKVKSPDTCWKRNVYEMIIGRNITFFCRKSKIFSPFILYYTRT